MTPGCNRKVRLEIFIHPWIPVYNYHDSQLHMTTYQIGLCSHTTKWTKRRVSWEWLIIFYPIWSSLEFSLRRNGQSFQKVWAVFSLRRYGQSQNEKTPLIIITNEILWHLAKIFLFVRTFLSYCKELSSYEMKYFLTSRGCAKT